MEMVSVYLLLMDPSNACVDEDLKERHVKILVVPCAKLETTVSMENVLTLILTQMLGN